MPCSDSRLSQRRSSLGGDLLPQGRGRGFEIREALAALGVLARGPAGQRFPGGGQAALLDGGGAETHHRVAGPAQVGPGRGLVVGEVLAVLLSPPARSRRWVSRGVAGLARASSARVIASSVLATSGSAGAAASAAATSREVPPGDLHGRLGRRHQVAGLVTGRHAPG